MANSIHSLLKKLYFEEPFWVQKAGGQTNRNFIVKAGNKKFFVRLPWETDVMNRQTEGRNIAELASNKKLQQILPRYHVYVLNKRNILDANDTRILDVPDGTLVTSYLAGREFTPRDFRKIKYQNALVRMLHVFHSSGVRFCNPYNVFRNEIRTYRKKAQGIRFQKFLDARILAKLPSLEKQAERNMKSLKRGIATHNDLLFQNVMVCKNNRLYLLDFEYAGQNTKGGIAYDYGFLFADNLFRSPPMTKKLFEQFLAVADKIYKKKLNRTQIYWSTIAALLVQIWWGILRHFTVVPKEKSYFREYVARRIQGIGKLEQIVKERGS